MAFEGESKEPIFTCPRCGSSSWQWKLISEEFTKEDGGYREYMCQACGLYIYENYAWSHMDWTDD